jgi:hypothetical protein
MDLSDDEEEEDIREPLDEVLEDVSSPAHILSELKKPKEEQV